ncbi:hypothetical protein D8B26_005320 [Coccidioides posadasii str. Silveira]|uniref:uncharacterized protein n=1 Tax=Coccidioides posadasii (strain RMSCC 757 / Silveira) TaxID=443226 RepID=UPI001BEEF3C7|nr:hypothetical protein D8B26_005320 [Coccidioides posadasii str. Silveira]
MNGLTFDYYRVELSVPIRLRRAILLNDAFLVKRIVRNNPEYLENPDYDDKSNTSLHLAAILGHLDIIKFLVDFGHDLCNPDSSQLGFNSTPGISLNTDSSTPLHLAAANAHADCVDFLCSTFPQTIDRQDKNGATPLMLAARASNPSNTPQSTTVVPPKQRPRATSNPTSAEDTKTVAILLEYGADVTLADNAGNTALHYASAWGNLKAFRLLVQCNAPPLVKNNAGSVPADYALTGQAAIYCRGLIAECGRHRLEEEEQEGEEDRERQHAQQQQQTSTKLSLKVKASELGQFTNEARISPVSPNETRLMEAWKRASSSPRRQPMSAGGVRLVNDDTDRDDDIPSTVFKVNLPMVDAATNGDYESD